MANAAVYGRPRCSIRYRTRFFNFLCRVIPHLDAYVAGFPSNDCDRPRPDYSTRGHGSPFTVRLSAGGTGDG